MPLNSNLLAEWSQRLQKQPFHHQHKPAREHKLDGLALRDLKDLDSFHSSVVVSEKNSSVRNIINSSIQSSQFTEMSQLSQASSQLSQVSKSRSIGSMHNKSCGKTTFLNRKQNQPRKSQRNSSGDSKQHEDPTASCTALPAKQKNVQAILRKYFETNMMQSLISFLNKQWEQQQQIFFKEKRFEALRNLVVQKTNCVNQIIQDFVNLEYNNFEPSQQKLIMSLLFKQSGKILKDYEYLFGQMLKRIPQDKIVEQETQMQELYKKLLQIFNPNDMGSNVKMQERMQLFMEGFTVQKNSLLATVVTKLKANLDFVVEMELYLGQYHKEIMRLRNQLQTAEKESANLHVLLKKKVNFTPLEIDYDRLREMKEESEKQLFGELQGNFIKYHQQLHQQSDDIIKRNEIEAQRVKSELQMLKRKIEQLQEEIYRLKHSVPQKTEAATQVHLLMSKKAAQGFFTDSLLLKFLENVSTPFSFTPKITASLISMLSIDKILFDYEVVRNKSRLHNFPEYMLEWFVIRTGSKKISQIFVKNFMYSIKELKGRHKRFNLFAKICGFNGFRKKNLQEDLEYIFFQTHKAWYYLIKVALIYRRKMNENPTGYQLFPPIPCEAIFKLPLRKVYEVIQDFLTEEGMEIPDNLNNKIDYYAINEICRFKSHDENFHKQQLQEIHILREINFDIIAGFIIEYIAKEKCVVVEKFLRTVSLKQKEMGDVLGYLEFENIYKKYFQDKRSKIQAIYSKVCLTNQHDMLDLENAEPIIKAILESESALRGIYDEMPVLKALILTQKTMLRMDRRPSNVNSYENFRERFYYEFYDFYNTTAFLEETYRIVKGLIRKKLRAHIKDEKELEQLIAEKPPIPIAQQPKTKEEENEASDEYEDEDEDNQEQSARSIQVSQKDSRSIKKNQLLSRIEQWGKIIVRIPHFGHKILTIDQIIVHNMRRKEMIDASEFAWKTLREILILLAKQ